MFKLSSTPSGPPDHKRTPEVTQKVSVYTVVKDILPTQAKPEVQEATK